MTAEPRDSLSRLGRVSAQSNVIPRGSGDTADTVDANSRSRAAAAVSHNMVGEQVVRRRTGNSQNNLSHKDVDSTDAELASVGVMTRSQNRQRAEIDNMVEHDTDSEKFVEQLGNIDICDSTTNDEKQTVFAIEQQADVGLQDCWAKARKGSNDFLVRKGLLYKRIPTYA